jgi:hypothetical protein
MKRFGPMDIINRGMAQKQENHLLPVQTTSNSRRTEVPRREGFHPSSDALYQVDFQVIGLTG